MRQQSICRRCHRLRNVNETRYCAGCESELRKMEQPRVSATADTQPPPRDEDDTLTETPIAKAIEAPAPDVSWRPGFCPNCSAASLRKAVTDRGEVNRCWRCECEYQNGEMVWAGKTAQRPDSELGDES